MLLTELIGNSPEIALLRDQAGRLVGRSTSGGRLPPTLIVGETGTGKGLLARALHSASARRGAALVDINCAAIPDSLLEAELFGVERGAFTGADRTRPGLFQAAHRGTLFLDEIALLPAALQSKLLKALEDGAVRRVGSTRSEPVDAWLLAATNEDLDEAMQAGRFRRDLYHRLSVVTLRLPPLRERGEDVVRLAEHFLAHVAAEYGIAPLTLSDEARAALLTHPWPGNVRELANLIERVTLLARGPVVTHDMLELVPPAQGARRAAAPPYRPSSAPPSTDAATERGRLVDALEATGWNLSRAAARLAIPRNTLRYRMERHGLREPPPSRRQRPAAADGGRVRRRLALLRLALGPRPHADVGEARLAELLTILATKVRAFGGRAEEVTRDAIVAAFGLEPVEDAPIRAALAAIAARQAVHHLCSAEPSGDHAARAGEIASVSAAIDVRDCDLVTAADEASIEIESASRSDAWPILEALVAAAPPATVVVSEAAAATLRRRFDLGPAVALPGKPGAVHQLVGPERTGPSPSQPRAAFTGRGDELGLLQGRLAAARAGHGQVVSIVGDAGIGKSRLLLELRRYLPSDVTFLEGRCASYATTTPYLALHDVVRAAARIDECDHAAVINDKFRALLDQLGMPATLAPYLVSIGSGSSAATNVATESNPGLLKTRTFEAMRHLVLALARRQPVVLAIEDAHWIDPTSDELLGSLVDAIAGVPALLAVTYRPGYAPAWLARAHVTQLALPPLSRDESRAVLRSMLVVPRAHAAADIEALLLRGEGNPLFLEELAQTLQSAPAAAGVAVPDTVHALLATRIAGLAEGDRGVLQAASVVGKDLPGATLEAIVDEAADVVHARLRRLQTAGLLLETRPGDRAEYTFKHALTQEVAYATLARERRRELHARVARLERRPESIARHLSAAGLVDDAVPHWLEAGRSALWRSANAEAVSHLQTALELLRPLPESPDRARAEVELQLTLGPALTRVYAFAEAEAAYQRADALCDRVGDGKHLLAALWRIHLFQLIRGQFPIAYATAETLRAASERLGEQDFRVESQLALGAPRVYQGRLAEGRRHIESAIALFDPERAARHAFVYGQDPLVVASSYASWVLVLQGHVADARAAVERAARRADALEHDYSRAFALYFTAIVADLSDDFAGLRDTADRLSVFAEERELPFWRVAGTALRGRALAAEGRHAEGLALMKTGRDLARAASAESVTLYFLRNIADAHFAMGATEDALRAVGEGLAACERQDYRTGESELHRIRGAILATNPATAGEAEMCHRRALALSRAQGAVYYERRAARALATHLRDRGRDEEAARVLADIP